MKSEEQRIAIAESFPDLFEIIPGSKDVLRYRNGGCYVDPLKDLNAMHEVENQISKTDFYPEYVNELYLSLTDENDDPGLDAKTLWPMIHATAAQRAEALLRTIGKWTDEVAH